MPRRVSARPKSSTKPSVLADQAGIAKQDAGEGERCPAEPTFDRPVYHFPQPLQADVEQAQVQEDPQQAGNFERQKCHRNEEKAIPWRVEVRIVAREAADLFQNRGQLGVFVGIPATPHQQGCAIVVAQIHAWVEIGEQAKAKQGEEEGGLEESCDADSVHKRLCSGDFAEHPLGLVALWSND